MPVVTLYADRLRTLVGGGITFQQIVDKLPLLGVHIEEQAGDHVRVEYDPNRPDYSTDYGVARSLRGSFGIETGLPRHDLKGSTFRIEVDPSVKEVRPCISGMLVKGLKLDDETIRQIISMQEDLCNGIGRKRHRLAIGIHNSDVVVPPLTYKAVPSSFRFVPLEHDRELSIEEILSSHPTGRKYGHLVSGHDLYPVITDSKGTVLSFPPIINGNATRVTTSSSNLFVDVTGAKPTVLEDALAIMAEAFWDAGAEVHGIEVLDGAESFQAPDLSPSSMTVPARAVSDLIGLSFKPSAIVSALRRARFNASIVGSRVKVEIPRYRVDILHIVDVAEEVMYGYGFEKLEPDFTFVYTVGSLSPRTHLIEAIRRTAVGVGLQEVMGYSLTSKEVLYDRVHRPSDGAIKVAASKSALFEYLKDMIVPTHLQLLAENVQEAYPQNIFEVAEVFTPDPSAEAGVKEDLHLAVALSDNAASFTDARSVLDTILLKTFAAKATYRRSSLPFLVEGRTAECLLDDRPIGFVGEVDPKVIIGFGLRAPVSVFEISLSSFFDKVAIKERV